MENHPFEEGQLIILNNKGIRWSYQTLTKCTVCNAACFKQNFNRFVDSNTAIDSIERGDSEKLPIISLKIPKFF
jgi:hypothetical protein